MIHQLAVDTAAAMHARGYPVSVYYGPERVTRDGVPSHTILFSRDLERGDAVRAPTGQRSAPRYVRVRELGVVALVRVQSTVPGAMQHEHERECDIVVDGLLAALCDLYTAGQRPPLEVTEARMLPPEDEQELFHGAVYRIRFVLPRAVERRDYDGAGPSTAVLADIVTSPVMLSTGGTDAERVPPLPSP